MTPIDSDTSPVVLDAELEDARSEIAEHKRVVARYHGRLPEAEMRRILL
jgi:hypothetical protein